VCDPGYDFASAQPGNAGHFSQVVWKGSQQFGVGRAAQMHNGLLCTYIVARYRPAGNFLGEFRDNVRKGAFATSRCVIYARRKNRIYYPPLNSTPLYKRSGIPKIRTKKTRRSVNEILEPDSNNKKSSSLRRKHHHRASKKIALSKSNSNKLQTHLSSRMKVHRIASRNHRRNHHQQQQHHHPPSRNKKKDQNLSILPLLSYYNKTAKNITYLLAADRRTLEVQKANVTTAKGPHTPAPAVVQHSNITVTDNHTHEASAVSSNEGSINQSLFHDEIPYNATTDYNRTAVTANQTAAHKYKVIKIVPVVNILKNTVNDTTNTKNLSDSVVDEVGILGRNGSLLSPLAGSKNITSLGLSGPLSISQFHYQPLIKARVDPNNKSKSAQWLKDSRNHLLAPKGSDDPVIERLESTLKSALAESPAASLQDLENEISKTEQEQKAISLRSFIETQNTTILDAIDNFIESKLNHKAAVIVPQSDADRRDCYNRGDYNCSVVVDNTLITKENEKEKHTDQQSSTLLTDKIKQQQPSLPNPISNELNTANHNIEQTTAQLGANQANKIEQGLGHNWEFFFEPVTPKHKAFLAQNEAALPIARKFISQIMESRRTLPSIDMPSGEQPALPEDMQAPLNNKVDTILEMAKIGTMAVKLAKKAIEDRRQQFLANENQALLTAVSQYTSAPHGNDATIHQKEAAQAPVVVEKFFPPETDQVLKNLVEKSFSKEDLTQQHEVVSPTPITTTVEPPTTITADIAPQQVEKESKKKYKKQEVTEDSGTIYLPFFNSLKPSEPPLLLIVYPQKYLLL